MAEIVKVLHAETARDIDEARALFLEYGRSLDFSLCFQSFEEELDGLPGPYAPPGGRLLLCRIDGLPAGCIALRRLDENACEMKRLYVRPVFRGRGLGPQLTTSVIAEARRAGYRVMRLDTIVGAMDHAIALYRSLGFREVAPYYPNPVPGALYMELDL